MKITKKILSIPPYISTTWANVASLSMMSSETGPLLIVELLHGGKVAIPGLEYDLLQSIFKAHEQSMEKTEEEETRLPGATLNFPLKLFGDNAEKMGMLLQHNPEDSDAPAMPQEMLDKISSMIKSLGLSETSTIPVPEEGCNCNFCQISRAIHDVIHPKVGPQESSAEEAVPEVELQFRDWDITSKGDELYDVTNRLDKSENYQVYLGKPIGCTCGSASCEHIRAVLRS